jgi:hypothetical protein
VLACHAGTSEGSPARNREVVAKCDTASFFCLSGALYCHLSKLRNLTAVQLRQLGWQPHVTWGDGLRATLAWYRKNGDHHWGDVSHVLRASHDTEPPALQLPPLDEGRC